MSRPPSPAAIVGLVAADVVREAAARRWILALGLLVVGLLTAVQLGLELEVVDGALAASRLFGDTLSRDLAPVDVALGPVYLAAAYLLFYGGHVLLLLATADFAPSLLVPGRIEHLLSLPIPRPALILGTYLGVLVVALLAYGAATLGFFGILAVKAGVAPPGFLAAGLIAFGSFAVLYSAVLLAAVLSRSGALSALAGLAVFVFGIVASHRAELAPLFTDGLARAAFLGATRFFPPIGAFADVAAGLAGRGAEAPDVFARALGAAAFLAAMLSLAIARFQTEDH